MVGIYTRVSTETQVREGFSLEAQREKGIEKAKSLGIEYQIFEERGKSASTEDIDNRPKLKRMIEFCDEGIITNVFVTELDRLSRNEIDSKVFFPPIHKTYYYEKELSYLVNLKATEKISDMILSIPIYPNLNLEERNYVIDKVIEFFET